MSDFQAIVVGSGAGGLSAALGLARSGFSVLLLEAMPSFGGYLNPFRRKSYTFDTGLHYLGELGTGGRFRNLLDSLGLSDQLSFTEMNPEGFDRYVFPDYEFRLGKGKEVFRQRLLNDFPKEERGVARFFDVFDKICKAMDASMSMSKGVFGMLGFLLKNPAMLKYSRIPYQKLLDETTNDKRLQAVLSAICGTYGLPPSRASVIIAVAVWNHYLSGAYYPKGGSGAFRDAFVGALKRHGAEMKNRSRVVSIHKEGDRFKVETESSERFTSRVVISDSDPTITLSKLIDPQLVPSSIKEKAKHLRPSIGGFYAFIGTDLDLPAVGITDANIHHFESFDLNGIYNAFDGSSTEEYVPGLFITSPSVKDPDGGHAPPNRHTLEVFTFAKYSRFEKWASTPALKRGKEYNAVKERMGIALVKTAEKHIPALSAHLDYVEYASPLSNQYWVNAVKGACYGPEQTPDQVGSGRFSDFSSGIDGIFLVGSGTLGGGIMPCVASGVLAAGKAAEYLKALA